ncbi:MAG: hypothetical protein K2V38_11915, partial [Gemmataceae bacterium]|nr:hypothetical protein [Gemmataceae bacterium]
MISPAPGTETPPAPVADGPPPEVALPPTPWTWRLGILAGVGVVGSVAYALHGPLGPRFQAGMGVICFLGLAAAMSESLRSVSRKTLLWGVGLQFALAAVIIHPNPLGSEYFHFEWVGRVFRT